MNTPALKSTIGIAGSLFLAAVIALLLSRSGLQGPTLASAEEKAQQKGEEKTKKKAQYVGVKVCKLCHSEEKSGDQFGQWEKTLHAKAYKSLGTAKAKELGAKVGVANPQKDAKCLKCHVTGAEEPALSRKLKAADGVQCETCHGAGQFYAKDEIFRQGREVAIAHGLIIPDEKLCVKCHNKESPTFPGKFDFKEMWKKVLHPNPLLKHEKK